MTFQWKLLKPARPISRLQKKTAVLIADYYLSTGEGLPAHDLNWRLGEKRIVLGELEQFGLIQYDMGKYYPTFPALYFLPPNIRNSYTDYLHYVMKAIQIVYKDGGQGRFSIDVVAKQMGEALKQDNGAKLGPNGVGPIIFKTAASFLRSFRQSMSTEPNGGVVIQSIIPFPTMIDYKNVSGAWKLELKLQQNVPAYLKPMAPAAAAATEKAMDAPKVAKDKAKKVFVIHGRDERLRAGVFDFLRALHLEPLEWDTAMGLTGNPAPYIGQVLDAAFDHAQAVVVLLSPDDEVRLREDLVRSNDEPFEKALTGQARPNVLFEAGMAFASHEGRTVLVQFGQVKPFSDVAGRHTVHMDGSVSKRHQLALKLKTAGCPVYMDGTDWHKSGDLTPPKTSPTSTKSDEIVEKSQTAKTAEPTNPKVAQILDYKGKAVTVTNHQRYGNGYLDSVWPNGAIVVDCNSLWVTLQDTMSKDNHTFSVSDIKVLFDTKNNRLQLELER